MARYIHNYEVIREIGSGHFGAVYLAFGEVPGRGRAPGKQRLVAIKKLKNTADQEALDLLLQEFSLLDQVKHRCIVRVFEFLEQENAVVMEFIHGVSLRKVLEELDKSHEQMFTEAVAEIGCELADGLYQAYTTPGDNGEPLQLVHRDLKPANVMLTPSGEVKILDFGLARVDNAEFTRDDPERIRGTPIYMAPEQARGEIIDHRSDLFALGLILYELLMGEPAYRIPKNARDPVREIFRAIESGNLREQCQQLEGRLPSLGPVVTRALQPRPDDRYRHGQDMLVDLRRQLYRDRGSYLQEFCDFFFGTIYDIGEPPSIEQLASSSRQRGPRKSNKSIEERLRESMARDHQASAQAGFAPRVARPRSTAPSAPNQRANMPSSFDDNNGRRPKPPVGGGASRAQPFSPPAKGGERHSRVKAIGERSPDETGMLQMVPLSNDGDGNEVADDPSATAFFAIPAPKASRPTPSPSPTSAPASGNAPVFGAAAGGAAGGLIRAGAPSPLAGGGGAGAPPPPQVPPTARPSYGQGIGVGNAGGVAQGPVVRPGNAGGGTPFQVQGPQPNSTSNHKDGRSRSYQVFAILFAVFALVCMAGVVAVAVIVTQTNNDTPDPTVNTPIAQDAPRPTPKPTPPPQDTGTAAEPDPTPVTRPKPKPKPPRPTVVGGSKPNPVASGKLSVRLTDPGKMVQSVEVVCPNGGRTRAPIGGGSATVNVSGNNCTMFFKGPAFNGKYGPVSGGRSLSCRISGQVVSCN